MIKGGEFFLEKLYGYCKEIREGFELRRLGACNPNVIEYASCLRLYPHHREPTENNKLYFGLQIRSYTSTSVSGKGKKRYMYSSVNITIEEVESMLDYMKKEEEKEIGLSK